MVAERAYRFASQLAACCCSLLQGSLSRRNEVDSRDEGKRAVRAPWVVSVVEIGHDPSIFTPLLRLAFVPRCWLDVLSPE